MNQQQPQYMNIDQALAGLNEASLDDRFPKLAARTKYLLKVTKCELKQGMQSGLTFVVEAEIAQSDNPTEHPGMMRTFTITNLDDRIKGSFKKGQLRKCLGGIFNVNPERTDVDWLGQCKRCVTEGIANGRYFLVQTDAETTTEAGFKYIPRTYAPYVG
jgi:hypothetical protein